MNEKPTQLVQLDGFDESERVIFKLIFSVSQRTKSRSMAYQIADDTQANAVALIIRNAQSATGPICVEVLNAPPVAAELAVLQRPLIATRVLTSLDRIIHEARDISAASAPQIAEPAVSAPGPSPEHNVTSPIEEDIEEAIEFSISEEEASELAIVQDESLSNPANTELEAAGAASESPANGEAKAPQDSTHHLVLVATNRGNDKEQPAPATESHDRICALVVDDSASVRKQLEIELDLFDVNVNYAENAQQAYELLQSKHYDVAFLDVVLPDQDGFSICKNIKSSGKDTNVIMLTGKATPADKVKGSLAGCDAYLVKPVGRMTFQNTVKNYIPLLDSPQAMGA